MTPLSIDDLVNWSDSEYGGLIVDCTPHTLQTVVYFLREFAVPTADPLEQLGAFRTGHYLVIGKRDFREDVIKGLRVSGDRYGMDF